MPIYILSASQISTQSPLSEEWLQSPIRYPYGLASSIDPDFRAYVSSKDFRRIGKLIKRALTTSHCALNDAGNPMLDAIVTGTGLGCVENTEKFLMSMISEGETLLTPTHFIYSTHNTISSQIALQQHCHGYNNTYSQAGISFDSALFDVYLQFLRQRIGCALVGGYDEMTPSYYELLNKISFWGAPDTDAGQCFAGESAMSMVLSAQPTANAWCRFDGMVMLYRPTMHRLQCELQQLLQQAQLDVEDIDTIVLGNSGLQANDQVYAAFTSLMPMSVRAVAYKPFFGEGFTMSGIATYIAAAMLHHQALPKAMLIKGNPSTKPQHVLVYNHFQNRHHSLILLSSC